jgi:hypothetical protein
MSNLETYREKALKCARAAGEAHDAERAGLLGLASVYTGACRLRRSPARARKPRYERIVVGPPRPGSWITSETVLLVPGSATVKGRIAGVAVDNGGVASSSYGGSVVVRAPSAVRRYAAMTRRKGEITRSDLKRTGRTTLRFRPKRCGASQTVR